ncbi:glycosyltransferase 87 family protein [Actinoplanes utahensis]|nr:glycosyltransferase 87 family protein [Actinoplanes utahensis]GIF31043.1 hypothetical protein Aut01nite_40290 [Actinoplanes utahensis]
MRSGWVALGVPATLAIITICLQRYGLSALAVEHEAIRGWLAGDGLYAYRAPGSQAGAALPPAMAVLLAPLTLFPLHLAGWLLAVAGIAALLLIVLIIAGPIARRHGRRRAPVVLAVSALALLAEPVRAALGQGRPELLILALLAADLVALRHAARSRHHAADVRPTPQTSASLRTIAARRLLRRPHPSGIRRLLQRPPTFAIRRALGGPRVLAIRRVPGEPRIRRVLRGPRAFRTHRADMHTHPLRTGVASLGTGPLRRAWTSGSWAGAGIGLATAVSVTPLLFIVYLLVTRQRRAALTALGTAAAVTALTLTVAPAETIAWFGRTMWELDRPAPISDPTNQSLAGVMARLYDVPAPPVLVWFSFSMLLVAVGLIRARSAHAAGDEVAAFTLVGLTTAVTGPVTTAPESLWLIPAVLVLADTGLRRYVSLHPSRPTRFAGPVHLAAAVLGYLTLISTPDWSLRWNIPAFGLILLVNTLPWRRGAPARPTPVTTTRRAAIPLPRGG